MSGKLFLVRHGQSEWNKQNLFTGWVDVPLSQEGIDEAFKVGNMLKGIDFDVVFTSNLIRSEMTAMLLLMKNKKQKVPYRIHEHEGDNYQIHDKGILDKMLPIYQSPMLNERMYGHLQGMNKDVARKNFGEEQVQLWRRSYDLCPPHGESLEMTKKRTLPYFEERILPYIKKGKTVLIVAHGNSLRSIIMELRQMTKEQILHYELATGEPVFFEWENHQWNLKTLD